MKPIQPFPFLPILCKIQGMLWLLFLATSAIPTASASGVTDPIVTNTNDSGTGSLRRALSDSTPGSTITFDLSLSGESIRLTSGQILVNKPLTIDASSLEEGVIISGDATNNGPTPDDSRVFVTSGAHLMVFDSLVIRGGRSLDGVDGVLGGVGGSGGGIFNQSANLTLRNCTITDNTTGNGSDGDSGGNGGPGGGIFNNGGTITLKNSSVIHNSTGKGGTASNAGPGAGGNGAGIFSSGGSVNILNSTISQNIAGNGANGTPTPGNGGSGGGIYMSGGTLNVVSSTVVENYAGVSEGSGGADGTGGGVFSNSATSTFTNTIVAGNIAEGQFPDIFDNNTVLRQGVNLIGNNQSVESEFPPPAAVGEPNANGDLVGTSVDPLDPQLGDLSLNGGLTQTLLPGAGSPVVNAADAAELPADEDDLDKDFNFAEALSLDQRGAARVIGSGLDIGAVERLLDRADIRLGKKSRVSTHKVDDFYTRSGSRQKLTVKAKGRRQAKFFTSIQNDGETSSLRFKSSRPKKGYRIKTFRLTGGRRNVSSAILRGSGFSLPNLNPGQTIVFQSKVKGDGGRVRQVLKYTASVASKPSAKDVAKPKILIK